MSKAEIIEEVARTRMVEQIVENTARRELDCDLKDLCQMVYVTLLEYEEGRLQDLWDHQQIVYFVARIVMNQLKSRTSRFYYTFKLYQKRSASFGDGFDISDKALEKLTRNG